jgi:hypothetical protein
MQPMPFEGSLLKDELYFQLASQAYICALPVINMRAMKV